VLAIAAAGASDPGEAGAARLARNINSLAGIIKQVVLQRPTSLGLGNRSTFLPQRSAEQAAFCNCH